MLLYLLRHANADTVAAADSQRPLSEKGFAEAEKVARFCAKHEHPFSVILTSPLLRTQQTAALVGTAVGVEPMVVQWAASGMGPETAVHELAAYAQLPSVLLVGHEPDLSQLIAHLLGLPHAYGVHVQKASLHLLEVGALRVGASTLRYSLPCRLM